MPLSQHCCGFSPKDSYPDHRDPSVGEDRITDRAGPYSAGSQAKNRWESSPCPASCFSPAHGPAWRGHPSLDWDSVLPGEAEDLAGLLQSSQQRVGDLERTLCAVSTQQKQADRVSPAAPQPLGAQLLRGGSEPQVPLF